MANTVGGVNAGVSGGSRASIGGSIAITGGGAGNRLMKTGSVTRSKLKKQGHTEFVTDDSDGVAYQNLVSDGLLGTCATKTHISGREIQLKNLELQT